MRERTGVDSTAYAGDPSVAQVLSKLGERGYPVTGQRRLLVRLIMSRTTCFSAEDLLREIEEAGSRIGRATVFRTLDLLLCLGYLSRVPNGGRPGYAVCGPGRSHHHHLVCSRCGEVLHLDDCPITQVLDELALRTGYQIEDHHLEVAGLCPLCKR